MGSFAEALKDGYEREIMEIAADRTSTMYDKIQRMASLFEAKYDYLNEEDESLCEFICSLASNTPYGSSFEGLATTLLQRLGYVHVPYDV
jgi:hypothetical protein